MTKVRTAEECLGAIQADSSWRKREITFLRSRIEAAEPGLEIQIRSSIVILYAHWEGFVKSSSSFYLEFINEQIRRRDIILSDHFKDLLMWKKFKKRGDHSFLKNPVPFLAMRKEWPCDAKETIPIEAIDTEANLNFKVLSKIASIAGLSIDDFVSRENLIDARLLSYRNKIAHGERVVVTSDEYIEIEAEVIYLIDRFQFQIETSVANSSFLAQ